MSRARTHRAARAGATLAAVLAGCALAATAARADNSVAAAFATAQPIVPLADSALGDQRAKYVIVAVPVAALRPALGGSASASGAASSAATQGGSRMALPASAGTSGGQVVYFGFDLSSAWTTHGPGGTTTYYASEAVGITMSGAKPVVTVASATGESGSGTAVPSSGNSVGAVNTGTVNGVAQAVQIAGNDNTVSNSATINVSSVHPVLVITAAGSACSACSVNVTPGQFGVGIALPGGGKVTQGLANGSLYQAVQLSSNNNVISNSMNLSLQVAPGSAQAVTIPVAVIPPTFGLVH